MMLCKKIIKIGLLIVSIVGGNVLCMDVLKPSSYFGTRLGVTVGVYGLNGEFGLMLKIPQEGTLKRDMIRAEAQHGTPRAIAYEGLALMRAAMQAAATDVIILNEHLADARRRGDSLASFHVAASMLSDRETMSEGTNLLRDTIDNARRTSDWLTLKLVLNYLFQREDMRNLFVNWDDFRREVAELIERTKGTAVSSGRLSRNIMEYSLPID